MIKALCIYHDVDMDGWCSAYIVKLFCSDHDINVDFLPMNYQRPTTIDDIKDYTNVFIVDCSIPKEVMEEAAKLNITISWFDHHRSAIKAYFGVEQVNQVTYATKHLVLNISEDKAACELTWEALYSDIDMPLAVKLISAWDAWKLDSPLRNDAVLFNQGSYIYNLRDLDDHVWKLLITYDDENTVKEIINSGNIIQQFREKQNKSEMETYSFTKEWEGYNWFGCNTTGNSSIADSVFADSVLDSTEHDGILLFKYYPKTNQYKISMYHSDFLTVEQKRGNDFSIIAKKYGGGGHAGACGFYVDKLPFELG